MDVTRVILRGPRTPRLDMRRSEWSVTWNLREHSRPGAYLVSLPDEPREPAPGLFISMLETPSDITNIHPWTTPVACSYVTPGDSALWLRCLALERGLVLEWCLAFYRTALHESRPLPQNDGWSIETCDALRALRSFFGCLSTWTNLYAPSLPLFLQRFTTQRFSFAEEGLATRRAGTGGRSHCRHPYLRMLRNLCKVASSDSDLTPVVVACHQIQEGMSSLYRQEPAGLCSGTLPCA